MKPTLGRFARVPGLILIGMVAALCAAEPWSLPDAAAAERDSVASAPTVAEAWRSTWLSWAERARGMRGTQTDEGLLAALPALETWAEERHLPPAALLPLAEMLVASALQGQPAVERLVCSIASSAVTQPVGDGWRDGPRAGASLLDSMGAIRRAIGLVEVYGGAARHPDFYRLVLERAHDGPAPLRADLERRFLADDVLATKWWSRHLQSPPEHWSSEQRSRICAAAGATEDRQVLLQRVLTLALTAPIASRDAAETRAHVLLEICGDEAGCWDGLLSDEALTMVEAAVATLTDVRKAALPWLMLLHRDRGRIETALRRHSDVMIRWALRVDNDGQPLLGLLDHVATQEPTHWSNTVPLLPFAMTDGIAWSEGNFAASIRYQGAGLAIGDSSNLWDFVLGVPARMTKSAVVAMLAHDESLLRTWWSDPAVHVDVERDPMVQRVLGPWAFAHQAVGPWVALPLQETGWDDQLSPPSLQWAMLARSGPNADAVAFLQRHRLVRPSGVTEHHLIALRSLASDSALLATFGDTTRLLPAKLPEDDVAAADLIDLHVRLGNNPVAFHLAGEAALRLSQARWNAVRTRVARNRPELSADDRADLVRTLLPYEPWAWSPLHTRVLALAPDHALMQETAAALGIDRAPVAEVARWFMLTAAGVEREFPAIAYLAAGRDPRLAYLLESLIGNPRVDRALLLQLSDPRIMRGWCLGLARRAEQKPRVDERAMLAWLATLTALRLGHHSDL